MKNSSPAVAAPMPPDQPSAPATTPRVPGGKRPSFRDDIAKSKVSDPKWEPFSFKAVGDRDTGGVLIVGAEPRIITRGPRKGQMSWRHIRKGDEIETFVAESEVRAAERAYETETGNCYECGGGGQQWDGWDHIKGTKYRTCSRCNGTGNARAKAESR